MPIHTILGAGGVIAEELATELRRNRVPLRLVSRHPKIAVAGETHAADLTDWKQTRLAVDQSQLVYLCVGLAYDFSIWREQWPKIMDNVIRACGETGSRLIFFDNVYMYGRVNGGMTEDTPYNPSSKKGDLRARIATQLMSEVRKGNLTAMIARAADFYGPQARKTSVANLLVFENLSRSKKAQWLVNSEVRHSFTFTPDAAKALYMLSHQEQAWNQVWHLPTANHPLTGKEFIEQAALAMGQKPAYAVLHKWMLRLAGLMNKTIRESYEMLYQSEFDYLFDSSKFEQAFSFQPTSYADGITATAAAYLPVSNQ